MADFLGFGHGIHGGIGIQGFDNPKIIMYLDTRAIVRNIEAVAIDTLIVATQGVIHVAPAHGSSQPSPVEFSWGAVSDVIEYQLEIATDPSFVNPVRSIITSYNVIEVDNLEDGTYYWRVRYR